MATASSLVTQFQFTRPQGARLKSSFRKIIKKCFNSRAHKGRDSAPETSVIPPKSFNSRAHKGRDLLYLSLSGPLEGFQFTRPQGARPCIIILICGYHSFNSRAHKGRDKALSCKTFGKSVSIHAPTRGATYYRDFDKFEFTVSIHAPTRGATSLRACRWLNTTSFNSRAHKGRDSGDRGELSLVSGFNSRAHKGRDRCSCSIFISISYITYLRELHLKLRKYRIK